MTGGSTVDGSSPSRIDPAVVVFRLAVLVGLLLLAFRTELKMVQSRSMSFSEWSHVFAMPLVVLVFVLCRKDDLRAALGRGSWWGIVLIVVGLSTWSIPSIIAQFGYAKLIGMLCCLAGVILALAGWGVTRICLPLILMVWLCLPLTERTMESSSLFLQRVSMRAAVIPLQQLPDSTAQVKGMTIAYQHGKRTGEIGLAEQRFGARLIPACFLIGLMVVFTRRRSAGQVAMLALLSVPIVLACNVLRITAWGVAAIYGGFDEVSTVPRNVSLVTMLLASCVCFGLGCLTVNGMGNIASRLFPIEDDQADEGGADQQFESSGGG